MQSFGQNMRELHPKNTDTDWGSSFNKEPQVVYKKENGGGISKNILRYGGFSLDLFFYIPIVMISRKDTPHSYFNLNPSLKIVSTPPKGSSYTPDRSFKIVPKNLPLVVRFFKEIVFWFDDPKKENLFVVDDNNELAFNYDYKDLKSLLKLDTYSGVEYLKAIPDTIKRNDKELAEGVRLMVNKQENVITLTYPELYSIYKTLERFDFTTEATMTYLFVSSLIKDGKYEFSENKYK